MTLLFLVFFVTLLIGVPIFIALASSSLVYTHLIAGIPDFVILHRMAGGVDSFPLLAVPFFILAGNLMNSAGITNRIYDFAVALVGLAEGRARACQRGGLGDLCRHVGHGRGRCRRARHHRDQGHARPRLQDRLRGRRHGGLLHHRADHSAVAADGHLRRHGQRLHRPAVRRRIRARPADGLFPDAVRDLVRPSPRHRARPGLPAERAGAGPSSTPCRPS